MLNRDEVIKKLKSNKNVLKKEYGVSDIAIFGSYSRGDFTEKSDIDLFVELDSPATTFDNFMDIKIFLEDLLNMQIDLAIKDTIRPELKSIIYQEALYV